ncbi:RNA-directed DNA polymerase, eukaryota, reverse transcriptase zinc-binding domain protein, partial [Tanacetum coccineum]
DSCWTCVYSKNNRKPIRNPYNKNNLNTVSSFYITNFPEFVDANQLWKACESYGRIVDAFISRKLSKLGKQFGFVRFQGVSDDEVMVRKLSNIWIDSFHLFVAVARVFYDVHVQELGTWNTKVKDNIDPSDSESDHELGDDISESESSFKNEHEGDNVSDRVVDDSKTSESFKEARDDHHSPKNTSDTSCPPGFEHFKNLMHDTSTCHSPPRCSTMPNQCKSNLTKNDFSLIHELSRIIEVVGAIGFDVKACRKALKKLIRETGDFVIDR